VTPPLAAGHDVFPLVGPYPPFSDTFGAARADVPWHHGDDLFAPRGAAVLAVTDGTLFAVGWNRIGGHRLWLIDRGGDEFYYAHLERYSRNAVDGAQVRAGELLGYVGTSGDAVGTPPHLFFEINPARLHRYGYDGAADPTGYLRRWTQLRAPSPAVVPLALTGSHPHRRPPSSLPRPC
jgi:murein DD-endopeptidase MepM/ murein hydrolase activator NlpD